MKKKILASILAATMVLGLTACGASGADAAANTAADTAADSAEAAAEPADTASDAGADAAAEAVDYGTGEIKVWVADAVVDFTKSQIDTFISNNPQFAGYTVTVEAVGEGDAAGNMITDVQGGADIYAFAQDQIARLVSAGALETVNPEFEADVKANNDAGSIAAATVGGQLYAYPLTSDNGYFLYYDKSVVTDPSSLEKILADCEAAGKNFYMEINSGWYQTAFFFATGCDLSYETDDQGNFTKANVSYASDAGVVALRKMIELNGSKAFQNGSAAGEATNVAAIVDGTWDSSTVKDLFGDNYACAKLPTFEGSDGKTYQLSGFGGFKLLGVKPQDDEMKLEVCDAIANYLAGGDVQLARYNEVGWGPSNLSAQGSAEVKADEALSALGQQLAFTVPQGQYPGDYWGLATSLGDSVRNGEISASSSDSDLMSVLQEFQDTCVGYAQ
ncbi:MAG: extracellular solute-binding protein [Lachnospiraceae bacterium]|nr:extracellular solute-binding protein [Lachnospiraceae bacterium]